MDDIQSWPEVPSVAHFCSLFRAAFNLLDFDIEELEEALLMDGAEDAGSSLLQELIVRLLCGCIRNHEISTFNYQMFLRRLFREKCKEYGRENPFNTDIDFQFLPLRVKVEILHALCDFRLDADDVPDLLKNLESDSLRVEPLGHDENRSVYWYFYGTRLYREDFPKAKKKIKERKKRRKEDKRKRRLSSDSDLDVEAPGTGIWQVQCYTESDWEELAAKLKGSSCRSERELHRTLVEDFLPEIPRLFAEKERLQRRRIMDYQPRRQSSRLEKLKQKENKDFFLEKDDDEKLMPERSDRFLSRISTRGTRRSSESGWEESGSELEEKRDEEEQAEERKSNKGRPAGRQTNNSLSSATGQIIIQPPKRKKLRSKQVFKTSPEDLLTGMYKILDYVKGHEDAWPFVSPVDEHYAPRYYSVIRRPMDLRRMEEKLDSGEYQDLNHFRDDFQLIVDNCRQYNGSENEYTEMVTNLLDAFNEAVNRYLESDPSSDEEVAVDFTARVEASRHRERRTREQKEIAPKRPRRKRRKKEQDRTDSASPSGSDREPPSLKPQKDKTSVSDNEGSVPGSDFDDGEPDFLREKSPPTLKKAESDNESKSQSQRRTGRGRHRRNIDLESLNAATEEALKCMASLLDDMPVPSGCSTASNSPHHMFDDFPNDPRPSLKPDRPFRNPREPVRRRKPIDLLRQVKRKDIRTIDRLQPGKSKGNLIANLPKPKDHLDDSSLSLGLGLGRTAKEGRNALLVKTDDTGPKLSLGTVLTNDILGFGKTKHNFDELAQEETEELQTPLDEDTPDVPPDEPPILDQPPLTPAPEVLVEEKEEESTINKENDPKVERPKEVASGQEKKRDAVKEITNKATPNASAWFKAFGAPKAPTTVKKKQEVPEPAPVVEEKETSWGAAAVPASGPRRQRKVSSSSSVSEPSSHSQDSPLHPVSPGLVSPRGEPPMPPVNGTLRVGFYQDMSTVQKSSPEKQSPHSTHSSPRELSNPSPFQGYSHVYPPSSPGTYVNYTAPTSTAPSTQPMPQPQPVSHGPPTSLYDNITPQYPSYSDQYRQSVRTVDNYTYRTPDPTPQPPKPNPSIFPVKKRLFANMDATRSMEVPKDTQSLQNDMGLNRSIERYAQETSYQQRSMGQYMTTQSQPEPESLQGSRLTPQADLTRLSMPPDMMAMGDKSKYPGAERSLNAMIESLGRMPSPARGFPSPLERLMQPPLNTIQEDSDGVFRNKYPTDTSYVAQRHQSPVTQHMVDRYEEERLLSSAYYDKNMYLKNVPPTSSLSIYQDTNPNPQSSYELNIPKPRDPKPPKKKKTVKGPETGGTTAFQQYVGLTPTEPSVPPIALKTTSSVPGSAFNFGPGLSNPLYTEGYLDELRQPAYYGMVGGAPPARGSSYTLPQYMGHQPGLVDGYQQYLQRVQEEQLRHSLAYPAGYHPALGMRPGYDRPSWL